MKLVLVISWCWDLHEKKQDVILNICVSKTVRLSWKILIGYKIYSTFFLGVYKDKEKLPIKMLFSSLLTEFGLQSTDKFSVFIVN